MVTSGRLKKTQTQEFRVNKRCVELGMISQARRSHCRRSTFSAFYKLGDASVVEAPSSLFLEGSNQSIKSRTRQNFGWPCMAVVHGSLARFRKSRKESLPSSCSKGRALDIEPRTIRDQGEDFVYWARELLSLLSRNMLSARMHSSQPESSFQKEFRRP